MSFRSLFAALATAWFLYLAVAYMAPGTFMTPDPTMEVGQTYREVLGGSELGLAMTSAVRAIAVGLALLAAAAFEWRALLYAYGASEARRRAETEAAPVTERSSPGPAPKVAPVSMGAVGPEAQIISEQGDADDVPPTG